MWILVVITACWIAVLFEQLNCRAFLYPDHPMSSFLWSSLCEGAKAIIGLVAIIIVLSCIMKFDSTKFVDWISSF